jgi:exosortase H (IPTLxxWG-CTERM-specific)
MRRFFITFIVVALAAYTLVYLPPIRTHVIGPFTIAITHLSGELIRLFGGQVSIVGNVLTIPGFSVEVLDLCNGVEATLVLWSALLAFPSPWGYKFKGLLIGTLTVHSLNIVRIISLLYLGTYNQALFHWVHSYLWDALIMLDILIVFIVWLRMMPNGEPKSVQVVS